MLITKQKLKELFSIKILCLKLENQIINTHVNLISIRYVEAIAFNYFNTSQHDFTNLSRTLSTGFRIYWVYSLQRSKTLPLKKALWVWHETASDSKAPKSVVYLFIAITAKDTLSPSDCTFLGFILPNRYV